MKGFVGVFSISTLCAARAYFRFTQRELLRRLPKTRGWEFSQSLLSRVECGVHNGWKETVLRIELSKFYQSLGVEEDAVGNMIIIRILE